VCSSAPERLAYTEVNGDIYFCNNAASGVVKVDDTTGPWGTTNGQGLWLSPVIDETPTLGPVAGQLIGDPIRASCIEGYKGRIYLADGKTLWATELYRYHLVNRTRGFMQFEARHHAGDGRRRRVCTSAPRPGSTSSRACSAPSSCRPSTATW
jgi:hypothetical protein